MAEGPELRWDFIEEIAAVAFDYQSGIVDERDTRINRLNFSF
jgi:hypothetical protein